MRNLWLRKQGEVHIAARKSPRCRWFFDQQRPRRPGWGTADAQHIMVSEQFLHQPTDMSEGEPLLGKDNICQVEILGMAGSQNRILRGQRRRQANSRSLVG